MFINKSHIIITKTDINRKMNISFKNLRIKIMIYSLSITLIDQISKFIVLITLKHNQSIRIIPNILNFTLVKNNGAAFSILSNSTRSLFLVILFPFKKYNDFNNLHQDLIGIQLELHIF